MPGRKKIKEHLQAAVIITVGLLIYKQAFTGYPNNLSDRTEEFLTAKSDIILKNLLPNLK